MVPKEGNRREYKGNTWNFYSLRFPKFSTLELRNNINGPQIQILREISAPELAPKVWKAKSRSKNLDLSRCLSISWRIYKTYTKPIKTYIKPT